MSLHRPLCFLIFAFSLGCGGSPPLVEESPESSPSEPDEAEIQAAMAEVELESSVAVAEAESEPATPGAFAMLTQGAQKKDDAPAKKKAAAPTAQADPGLGGEGGRTLGGDEVQAGIRPNLPQVRACYEKELKKGGDFGGKVVVAWTIGADGKVRNPRVVGNSTGNRAMLPCITRVVSRWRFAKAESPTDIEYPFRFKPSLGF